MISEKKEDRRVRYTKKAIRDSFYTLLEQKPLEKISVTELCKEADINRGTFYSHYKDPYDLKDKIIEELSSVIKSRIKESGAKRITTEESLRLLKENQELCRVFAGENGDFNALIKIISVYTSEYLDEYEHDIINSLSELRAGCLKVMIISSITAVVKIWIDGGMAYEAEDIAEMLRTYIGFGVNGFKNNITD